jgi:probable rRNA maturation factor
MNEDPDQQSDIQIDIVDHCSEVNLNKSRIEELIRYICREFSIHKATINVSVVDDNMITDINRDYLGHDYTTDVISFDLTDTDNLTEGTGGNNRRETKGERFCGGLGMRVFDIMVNYDMAQRQSRDRGHSAEAETALYITHGMLHNLGFDDNTDQNADTMHKKEDEILSQLGFGFVYNKQ